MKKIEAFKSRKAIEIREIEIGCIRENGPEIEKRAASFKFRLTAVSWTETEHSPSEAVRSTYQSAAKSRQSGLTHKYEETEGA